MEPRRSRHQPVGRFDAAAREDEFAGQEPVPLVTAAEQNLRHGMGAVDQNQGRRIPRPDIGIALIAQRPVKPFGTVGGAAAGRHA